MSDIFPPWFLVLSALDAITFCEGDWQLLTGHTFTFLQAATSSPTLTCPSALLWMPHGPSMTVTHSTVQTQSRDTPTTHSWTRTKGVEVDALNLKVCRLHLQHEMLVLQKGLDIWVYACTRHMQMHMQILHRVGCSCIEGHVRTALCRVLCAACPCVHAAVYCSSHCLFSQ